MDDPKDKDQAPGPDQDLAAEIRRGRRFSLSEAIGRAAGGSLKGASPVAPARQLVLAAAELVATGLVDSEGSLGRTLVAQLAGDPPLLARHFDDPRGALGEILDGVLASPARLELLVRQTDAQWGRDYDERPRFERADESPRPDDPYTIAGVRDLLAEFRTRLSD
jgi:hypothetical protein